MRHREVVAAIAEMVGPVVWAMVTRKFGGWCILIPKKQVDYRRAIATHWRLGMKNKKELAKKVGCTYRYVDMVVKTLTP